MNTFSEILKQFSAKHKAGILFMLLVFTTGSFVGGKYFDSVQTQKDVIELENSKTSIEKNCETQKQAILATQKELQSQLSSILTDLISLKKEMLAGQIIKTTKTQIDDVNEIGFVSPGGNRYPITESFAMEVDSLNVGAYRDVVLPVSAPLIKKSIKPTKSSSVKSYVVVNKKADALIDSLVNKTKNLIKK